MFFFCFFVFLLLFFLTVSRQRFFAICLPVSVLSAFLLALFEEMLFCVVTVFK